jgi:hypothetical protein
VHQLRDLRRVPRVRDLESILRISFGSNLRNSELHTYNFENVCFYGFSVVLN